METYSAKLYIIKTISHTVALLAVVSSCQTTAQYDHSKKYYLSKEERKAETFTVDQAHALIEKNLKTDHTKDTQKLGKKQQKELKKLNQSPQKQHKKEQKKKSGNIDLY